MAEIDVSAKSGFEDYCTDGKCSVFFYSRLHTFLFFTKLTHITLFLIISSNRIVCITK